METNLLLHDFSISHYFLALNNAKCIHISLLANANKNDTGIPKVFTNVFVNFDFQNNM